MNGPIVTVDVSKGNCHYQGFKDISKSFSKVNKMNNSKIEFNALFDYQKKLSEETGVQCVFVFEATGVYHKVLEKFLIDNELVYYMISPLLSAKFRQTEIHANKTDALDCTNIAKVFYLSELRPHINEEGMYEKLRKMNRHYENQLVYLRKMKVDLRIKLDIVFPNFDKAFLKKDIYAEIPLLILKEYSHPEILLNTKEEKIVKYIIKNSRGHQEGYIRKIVSKVLRCAEETYSGCHKDDLEVVYIKESIRNLQSLIDACEASLQLIIELAQTIPHFDSVRSIVGIGDNLAARIIAELGDLNKFDNRNQLCSYAGVDPMIRQSGRIEGTHLRISKKGNKYLRTLLYLAVTCNVRLKKEDPINNFYQKKRQQSNPLKSKAAKIAACHKLLTIIFAMTRNGSLYSF